MEITFKGGNSILLTSKTGSIIFDNNQKALGLPEVKAKNVKAVFQSMDGVARPVADALFFDGPGEYEVDGFSVTGIPARAHMDAEGGHTATIFRIDTLDATVLITGHIYPKLTEEELEKIGMVDILIAPVGGAGYTLDPEGAASIVKKVGPKVVIPTHYKQSGVNYEVPQGEIKDFIIEMGGTAEKMDKFKVKGGLLSETLQVIELERS